MSVTDLIVVYVTVSRITIVTRPSSQGSLILNTKHQIIKLYVFMSDL